MSLRKFLFPDTNIFEQFQPIENIDWPSLATCDEVTLVIAPIVVAELNKHKDTADRARLRNRAAAALKRFHEHLDTGLFEIRPHAVIEFRTSEPLIDFKAYRLDPGIADDRLIAAAVDFALEKNLAADQVLVATGDFGLRLKAASQSTINPLLLPSQLRLAEEIDSETKKIKDLEREIAKLRASIPSLKITFSNGASFGKYKLQTPVQLDETAIHDFSAKVEKKYPLREETALNSLTMGEGLFSYFVPDIPDYNRKLKEYYSSMRSFLNSSTEFVNARRRTVKLDLIIVNEGTAPATDIDIRLHFPDGFQLKRELSPRPKEPAPPDSPEETVRKRFSLVLPDMGYINPRVPDIHFPEITNLSLTKLKKTNSYDVEFHVKSLKHTNSESLSALYAVFDNYESVKSFAVEYSVLASNMPAPFDATLNVIIEK